MTTQWWERLSKDVAPLFEKLANLTGGGNDHLGWIEAFKLFVSRKNPDQVIAALKDCDESFRRAA